MSVSLGVEMEMPVVEKSTGKLHLAKNYFQRLQNIKEKQGIQAQLVEQGGQPMAVVSDTVCSSVDNGFNNLESAIGPIKESADGLSLLSREIDKELTYVHQALAAEDATVINFSQHPNTEINQSYYLTARSPKPIYDYWVDYRGWSHSAGIDAKAHNGPTTGCSFADAVEGLNVLIGLSSVFIALFANSPFVAGTVNGIKENRQNLWPAMFATSRFDCDRKLHLMPEKPFTDLRSYFQWMFGAGTNMQVIPGADGGDYKKPFQLLRVENDPPLLDFLRQKSCSTSVVASTKSEKIQVGHEREVRPRLAHLEFLQFSQFLDARIRYQFADSLASAEDFLEHFDSDKPLESFFEANCCNVYLEGRAAGANFPDVELASLADTEVAKSVVIAPSALQFGLLRSGQKALGLVNQYDWSVLKKLRQTAIVDGLHGEVGEFSVATLCRECLNLAAAELPSEQQWMLTYPEHNLTTMQNGADRALAFVDDTKNDLGKVIKELLIRRRMVPPEKL